jgi:hypothetical protein
MGISLLLSMAISLDVPAQAVSSSTLPMRSLGKMGHTIKATGGR